LEHAPPAGTTRGLALRFVLRLKRIVPPMQIAIMHMSRGHRRINQQVPGRVATRNSHLLSG